MGLVITAITFWLSRTIIHSLTRFGEKLEAVVSVLAVIILVIVTNWVFHRVYWVGWNSKLRSLSKSAQRVESALDVALSNYPTTLYRVGVATDRDCVQFAVVE